MSKLNQHLFSCALPVLAAGLMPLDGLAASSPIPSPASDGQKPAWLTEFSLGMKETYDDSVYLSSLDTKYVPANYTVPAGSVAALKDLGSWVTTVSPKVGVDFAPLLGDQKVVKTLSLAYTPDFAIYHQRSSEDFDAHRMKTAIKAGAGAFTFTLDDVFSYIHGSEYGPTYPGGYLTAYNTVAPRERREQIQNSGTLTAKYEWADWFIRPTASLAYYDLMTRFFNITGYQNYEDRYDLNGGTDLGYQLTSTVAVTLGYRYGHQYQQQFDFSPYSAPNDYQRVLVGVEGNLSHWLVFKLQGGPDFRSYAGDTATHITPVNDLNLVTYYGEALLTATITPKDQVTVRYKQWQWVSSIGKVPYFDSTYDLNYHRKLTNKLGLDLGGRLLTADYNSGNLAACQRNDWQYTVSAGAGYAFNPHCSANLAYSLDLGRNDQGGILNPDTRAYNHQLVSLGVQYKF